MQSSPASVAAAAENLTRKSGQRSVGIENKRNPRRFRVSGLGFGACSTVQGLGSKTPFHKQRARMTKSANLHTSSISVSIYLSIYIYIYVYIYMYVYMYTCIYVYMCICTKQVYAYVHTHTYVQCVYIYTQTCVYTDIHVRIYIYIYIYIYISRYVCICICILSICICTCICICICMSTYIICMYWDSLDGKNLSETPGLPQKYLKHNISLEVPNGCIEDMYIRILICHLLTYTCCGGHNVQTKGFVVYST